MGWGGGWRDSKTDGGEKERDRQVTAATEFDPTERCWCIKVGEMEMEEGRGITTPLPSVLTTCTYPPPLPRPPISKETNKSK